MTASAKQHITEEAYTSWRQRSELDKLADLPRELDEELTQLDQDFWVSGNKLKEIVSRFREELDEGLSKDGQNIPMNVAWVHNLPTGKEKGTILTLDLGGTNLRVCKVDLHGDEAQGKEKSTLDQEQYTLPEELKTGDAEGLWTFIAEKVETFVEDKGLDKEYSKEQPMPLGFTFSYPATQERIDHAVLQTWTKGFDIKGVEGNDVAQQLRDKLEERGLPIELVCVVNDTVGAMIASAYNDSKTIIGAIFGTGCNAAYMASLSDIRKLDPKDERVTATQTPNQSNSAKDQKMAINCEYGAFDNAHRVLPRTQYDSQIDAESPRPGEQTFEKLSAGLYLGEIFRLILLDLADRNLVFNDDDQDTEKLRTSYAIDTGFLSQIEDDESPSFTSTRTMFRQQLNLNPSDVEIELARRLAEVIAVRGARLCACGVAAICTKEGIKKGHVAADGSVANKHPKFKRRWAKALGRFWGGRRSGGAGGWGGGPIKITSAEDGSGVGCAIIAAMEIGRRGKGGNVS
ncbi:Hexokinase isoenzyme 2 [Neocucurbitaria cava]|uniref:Phosphotransferase n=1 Tax=Neocucurbitaria cava TaxID=798079 RepID=A0A9W9CJJ6_9PLEO|nr:Hexokinase isoenzyme 2 [Neocucurbitaria cava]